MKFFLCFQAACMASHGDSPAARHDSKPPSPVDSRRVCAVSPGYDDVTM